MTLTITNRELRLEVAHNVRHIGGYTTSHGRTTSDAIVRSAGLHRLTLAGVGHLADAGIRTVVDLRSTVERQRDVTPDLSTAGIAHVIAPVFEQDHSPVGMDAEFPGYAVVYQRMLVSGRNAYRTLFEVLAESPDGVLFHCAAGKDRTGVAAALMLGLAGVDSETIVEDYQVSYELLRPLLDEWLPKMAERGIDAERAQKLMASPAEDMRATLEHIETTFGSAEGYLRDIGLSSSAIDAAKARIAS